MDLEVIDSKKLNVAYVVYIEHSFSYSQCKLQYECVLLLING